MGAVNLRWDLVVEGDRVKSVKTGKFYEVTATVAMKDGIHLTLTLPSGPKTIVRPTAAEPSATVIRGETGKAVDVFVTVMSSR